MAEADSTKPTKECATCGAAFTPRQYNQKYCSRACNDRNKATCLTCGVDYYTTRNSRGKYCSVACSLKQTHAARRLARREKEDALRERNQGKACRVSIEPCICCERELVGPRPSATWAGKFCRSCKDALGNAIGTHPNRLELLRLKAHGRKCEVCGDVFRPYQETTAVCSKACEKQTDKYKRARLAEKLKRRAMKRTNGPYETIDPIAVFQRDGWACYLCGTETPRRLRGTIDDSAPELDHIDPLSNGGTHTWANVACACRKCNQDKSDNSVVEICGQLVVVPGSGKSQGARGRAATRA